MTIPVVKLLHGKQVKLGRVRSSVECPTVKFRSYFKPSGAEMPHPPAVDYATLANASLRTMLGNDDYGNCVIVGKLHQIGLWSANDADSGGEVMPTTVEAVDQYRQICGPGDNGCDIRAVLNVFRDRGLVAGGRTHLIDGYVSVEPSDRVQVEAAAILFGGLTLGINVPRPWLDVGDGGVWDITQGPFVGGHDVCVVAYTSKGVVVSTWGSFRTITWRAMADRKFVDECYAELAPGWYGNDKLSPSGVDVAGLQAALAIVKAGGTPPIDPSPIPAPPIPTPPAPIPPIPGPIPPVRPIITVAIEVRDKRSGEVPIYTVAGTIRCDGLLPMLCGLDPTVLRGFDWVKFTEFVMAILAVIIPLINKGMTWHEIGVYLRSLVPVLQPPA